MKENQTWSMTRNKIIFNWQAVKYRPDLVKRGLILFGNYNQNGAVSFDSIETYDSRDREKLIDLIKKHLTYVNT